MNKEIQYSMTDEYPIHQGRASTGGTSTARKLSFTRNHLEEDGKRTTWRPGRSPTWRRCQPSERRTCEAPCKGPREWHVRPLIARGGGANVQCEGKATR
jgi:hypothetical protein